MSLIMPSAMALSAGELSRELALDNKLVFSYMVPVMHHIICRV